MILLAVFTGCGDGVARAYDAKSATLKRIFQGHEGAINCLVCVDDKLYTGTVLFISESLRPHLCSKFALFNNS